MGGKGSGRWKKEDFKPTAKGASTHYIRHALKSLGLPKIDLSDANAVAERIAWYFESCAEDDLRPSVAGMANALGIERQTLLRWANGLSRTYDPTYKDAVKQGLQIINETMESYLLNNDINAIAAIFLMKNNFGYTDSTVTEGSLKAPQVNEEKLRKKYLEQAPIDIEIMEKGSEVAVEKDRSLEPIKIKQKSK